MKKNYLIKLIKSTLIIFVLFGFLKTKAQNPLSPAQGFNLFSEGNLNFGNGDIEGAIAVGGNITITGNAQRTSNNATNGVGFVTFAGTKYAMIVGGDIISQSYGLQLKIDGKAGATDDHFVRINANNLSIAATSGGFDISKTTDINNKFLRINATNQASNTIQSSTALINFAAAFTTLRANSLALSTLNNSVSKNLNGGQLTINLNNTSQNVWNVTGNDLNSVSQINLTGNLPSATSPFIININAGDWYSWNNLKFIIGSESDASMEVNRAPYIIYNFYNSNNLNISQPNLILGSILGPNTNIFLNASGNIAGQVIGKSITKQQAGEFHIAKFSANVVTGVLPVNLLSFNGTFNNNIVKLNWSTSNEISVSKYEIEKSINGVDFNLINTLNALTTNTSIKNYESVDYLNNTVNSKMYYRLKMIDKDGAFKYSNIVVIRTNDIKISNVYPNPFVESFTVELSATTKESVKVNVLDVNGKLVHTQLQQLQIGNNQFMVNGLSKLPKSNYVIEINTSNEKIVKKLSNQ